MMRIASEFGFTPASRSRISAPPPDQLPLLDLRRITTKRESLREGGRSIPGEEAPRGPAPLPFRDFFLVAEVFGGRSLIAAFRVEFAFR